MNSSSIRSFSQIKKLLQHPLLAGTAILTLTGIASRIVGFFFRIFLSRTLGEEGMGIYQLSLQIPGICVSITALSLQTAVSRMIAAHKKEHLEHSILFLGCMLSLSLALLLTIILYPSSEWLAVFLLKEPRCAALIQVLLLSLPLQAIHGCIAGYHYGNEQVLWPSVSMLIEQLVRILTTIILWQLCLSSQAAFQPVHIAIGILTGELAADCFLLLQYLWLRRKNRTAHNFEEAAQERLHRLPSWPIRSRKLFKETIHTALPFSANRLCLTVFQSLEAILIPQMLIRFGMTPAEALSLLGVLTGMAMPLLLFPNTVITSASVLLVPSMANAHTEGEQSRITVQTEKSIRFCLWLGCYCTVFFLLFASELGELLFQSDSAGILISILSWLCPFLYLTTACAGILNGLGKLLTVFFHSLSAILLRLLCLILLTPVLGIKGTLLGILGSYLLQCLLHLLALKKASGFSFFQMPHAMLPVWIAFLCGGISLFYREAVPAPGLLQPFLCFLVLTASYLGLSFFFRKQLL